MPSDADAAPPAAAPQPNLALPPLGAVVDLDGTLLNTEPLYFQAYADVARELGHAEYTFDGVHRYLLGRAEHEGAGNFARILGADLTPEEVLRRRDVYLLRAFASTRPLPGAVSAMAALRAAGLRMAIATSSRREYLALKATGNDALFSLFDAVVCGDDAAVGGHSKPHPAIFLAGAAAIGVPPERCVAFEDSLAGIASARAAGMRVVAVPDPRLDPGEVAAAGPHVTLSSLEGLDAVAHVGVAPPPALGAGAGAGAAAAAGQ